MAAAEEREHDFYLVLALINWATHYLRSQVMNADPSTKADIEREAADLDDYIHQDLVRFGDEATRLGGVTLLLPFEVRSMVIKILPAGRMEGPSDVKAREPVLNAILDGRPDAGGDLYALHQALVRARNRGERIIQGVSEAADMDELAARQLNALNGLNQRRVLFLDAGVASLLEIERFFDNATFVPSVLRLESMPASGPRGIGLVVPDDDRIVGPAFAFRRAVDDAAFQERWRPHSARGTFIAHPQHPEPLLRFMPTP